MGGSGIHEVILSRAQHVLTYRTYMDPFYMRYILNKVHVVGCPGRSPGFGFRDLGI